MHLPCGFSLVPTIVQGIFGFPKWLIWGHEALYMVQPEWMTCLSEERTGGSPNKELLGKWQNNLPPMSLKTPVPCFWVPRIIPPSIALLLQLGDPTEEIKEETNHRNTTVLRFKSSEKECFLGKNNPSSHLNYLPFWLTQSKKSLVMILLWDLHTHFMPQPPHPRTCTDRKQLWVIKAAVSNTMDNRWCGTWNHFPWREQLKTG